jgi:MFS family permease
MEPGVTEPGLAAAGAVKAEPLLTPRFLVVIASGLCYFSALGALNPVVPRYVDKVLDGGDVGVGIAVGAFALGAIMLRPVAGRIGDRFGRRVLMIVGAAIVGVMVLISGLVEALPYLVVTRIGVGLGEALFFVGGTTMVTDLAPIERRGEAVSYWSVAVWGGLSLGPVLGEVVLDDSHYTRVWVTAGCLALAASIVALATRETRHTELVETRAKLIARQAVAPGTLLAMTLFGIVGFQVFLPLYAPEVGVGDVGLLFLVYGIVVLAVRILGARVPDTLGPKKAGSISMGAATVGLLVVAAMQNVPGLLVGTVLIAVGSSFLYPALLLLALHGIREEERGSVVGTFSAFFDFAGGMAGVVVGALAAITSYPGAFGLVAGVVLAALLMLRAGFGQGHYTGPHGESDDGVADPPLASIEEPGIAP